MVVVIFVGSQIVSKLLHHFVDIGLLSTKRQVLIKLSNYLPILCHLRTETLHLQQLLVNRRYHTIKQSLVILIQRKPRQLTSDRINVIDATFAVDLLTLEQERLLNLLLSIFNMLQRVN